MPSGKFYHEGEWHDIAGASKIVGIHVEQHIQSPTPVAFTGGTFCPQKFDRWQYTFVEGFNEDNDFNPGERGSDYFQVVTSSGGTSVHIKKFGLYITQVGVLWTTTVEPVTACIQIEDGYTQRLFQLNAPPASTESLSPLHQFQTACYCQRYGWEDLGENEFGYPATITVYLGIDASAEQELLASGSYLEIFRIRD